MTAVPTIKSDSCVACGQVDDHPRHSMPAPDGDGWADFHMDCHATLGCPTCVESIRDAAGATGDAFRAHLVAMMPAPTADGPVA